MTELKWLIISLTNVMNVKLGDNCIVFENKQ
jgi:hypothetical protein